MSLGSYAQLTEEWGLTFPGNGEGQDDYVWAIDFDDDDNVISVNSESWPDAKEMIRKHNASGNLLWEKEIPISPYFTPELVVRPNQNILSIQEMSQDLNITLSDGSLFNYSNSGDKYHALFIMNDFGDIIEIKMFAIDSLTPPGSLEIYDLMVNENNEIFITLSLNALPGFISTVEFDSGNTISTDINSTGLKSTYIVKLDGMGNYLNHVYCTSDGVHSSYLHDNIIYSWANVYDGPTHLYKYDMDLNQLMDINSQGESFSGRDIFVNEFGIFVSGQNSWNDENNNFDFDFGNNEYIIDSNLLYNWTGVIAGYSHNGELKFVNNLICPSYGFDKITGRDSYIYSSAMVFTDWIYNQQEEIFWSNGLIADLAEDNLDYGNLVIAQMDYNGNNISTYNRDIYGGEQVFDLKTDKSNNLYAGGILYDTLFIFNNSILSSTFHGDAVLLKFGNLPLEINNISNPPMDVYPNPTGDYIHFKSDNYKGKQYRITNTVGQTILNGNIKDDLTKIDVRNLQRGSYILHIENISKAVRFIIQ